MFYGGALLRHLSPLTAVEEFVSLPRLNRNFGVVIDSDKTKPTQKLNSTNEGSRRRSSRGVRQRRLGHEGYTIENYVPRTFSRRA